MLHTHTSVPNFGMGDGKGVHKTNLLKVVVCDSMQAPSVTLDPNRYLSGKEGST